ncbi:hypothetical protein L9F63_015358 [Diploptera punctata]|uniref:DRBM domain-containing protein n=1 Tax=Diploptera punctata TaxID=6984 RepID=A0AAD8A7X6_DIPPU|nr:hypothetical protein L9F63_015358 [Diploptera punctata]
MCIRRGNPPQYDLIHDGGGTHEAIFKYRVQVDDVTAIGSGRSKKEAKHDAARNMLQRLREDHTSTPEPMVEEIMEVGDVMSPYKDNFTGNAIGALQELCMVNEIQLPKYELIGDEGPPHAKQFTIKCRVSKLTETAVARTKKQAKQSAANKMLNLLQSSLADVLSMTAVEKTDVSEKDSLEQISDIAVNKYKEFGTHINRTKTVIGQKISEYHLMLRSLKSDLLDKVKEDDSEVIEELNTDPVDLLNRLLTELNIDSELDTSVKTKDANCHAGILASSKGNQSHLVFLSMTTSPEAVLFGMGSSEFEARMTVAQKAIEYLKLMNI